MGGTGDGPTAVASYGRLRRDLDEAGYRDVMPLEALPLVQHLFRDLTNTTHSLRTAIDQYSYYKQIADELETGVAPFKVENVRLIQENSHFRMAAVRLQEDCEDRMRKIKRRVEELEEEKTDLKLLVNQYREQLKQLEIEFVENTGKIPQVRGKNFQGLISTGFDLEDFQGEIKDKMEFLPNPCYYVRVRNCVDLEKSGGDKAAEYFKMTDARIEALQMQIRTLKNAEKQMTQIVSSMKCKVENRDKEIEKLRQYVKVRPGSDNLANGMNSAYSVSHASNKDLELQLKSALLQLDMLQKRNINLENKLKSAILQEHEDFMLGRSRTPAEREIIRGLAELDLDSYPSRPEMTLNDKLRHLEVRLANCIKEKTALKAALEKCEAKHKHDKNESDTITNEESQDSHSSSQQQSGHLKPSGRGLFPHGHGSMQTQDKQSERLSTITKNRSVSVVSKRPNVHPSSLKSSLRSKSKLSLRSDKVQVVFQSTGVHPKASSKVKGVGSGYSQSHQLDSQVSRSQEQLQEKFGSQEKIGSEEKFGSQEKLHSQKQLHSQENFSSQEKLHSKKGVDPIPSDKVHGVGSGFSESRHLGPDLSQSREQLHSQGRSQEQLHSQGRSQEQLHSQGRSQEQLHSQERIHSKIGVHPKPSTKVHGVGSGFSVSHHLLPEVSSSNEQFHSKRDDDGKSPSHAKNQEKSVQERFQSDSRSREPKTEGSRKMKEPDTRRAPQDEEAASTTASDFEQENEDRRSPFLDKQSSSSMDKHSSSRLTENKPSSHSLDRKPSSRSMDRKPSSRSMDRKPSSHSKDKLSSTGQERSQSDSRSREPKTQGSRRMKEQDTRRSLQDEEATSTTASDTEHEHEDRRRSPSMDRQSSRSMDKKSPSRSTENKPRSLDKKPSSHSKDELSSSGQERSQFDSRGQEPDSQKSRKLQERDTRRAPRDEEAANTTASDRKQKHEDSRFSSMDTKSPSRPTENQPSLRSTENKPSLRSTKNKPSSRSTENKPSSRVTENQPSLRSTENKPSSRPLVKNPSSHSKDKISLSRSGQEHEVLAMSIGDTSVPMTTIFAQNTLLGKENRELKQSLEAMQKENEEVVKDNRRLADVAASLSEESFVRGLVGVMPSSNDDHTRASMERGTSSQLLPQRDQFEVARQLRQHAAREQELEEEISRLRSSVVKLDRDKEEMHAELDRKDKKLARISQDYEIQVAELSKLKSSLSKEAFARPLVGVVPSSNDDIYSRASMERGTASQLLSQREQFEMARRLRQQAAREQELEAEISRLRFEAGKSDRDKDEMRAELDRKDKKLSRINQDYEKQITDLSRLQSKETFVRPPVGVVPSSNDDIYSRASMERGTASQLLSQRDQFEMARRLRQQAAREQELEDEISRLRSSVGKLDRDKDEMRAELDRKDEKLARLSQDYEKQVADLSKLQLTVKNTEYQLGHTSSTAREHEREVQLLKRQLETMRRELEAAQNEREEALKDCRRLASLVSKEEHEKRNLGDEFDKKSKEADELKKQVQKYIEEVRRIEDLLQQKEEEMETLIEHYSSLSVERTTLETQRSNLEREASSIRDDVRETVESNITLKNQLATQNALIASYEQEIERLTLEVATMENQLSSLREQEKTTDADMKAARDMLYTAETKMDKLRLDLANADAMKAKLEAENQELKTHIEALEFQIKEQMEKEKKLQDLLASVREKEFDVEKTIEDISSEKDQLSDKLKTLQSRSESLNEEVTKFRLKSIELQTDLDRTRRQLQAEKTERETAIADLRRLQEQLNNSSTNALLNASLAPQSGGSSVPGSSRMGTTSGATGPLPFSPMSEAYNLESPMGASTARTRDDTDTSTPKSSPPT